MNQKINWPELGPNDKVIYQNDVDRPNRLVLIKVPEGFSIRIDTPAFDSRSAPFLSKEVLVNIAFELIRAAL